MPQGKLEIREPLHARSAHESEGSNAHMTLKHTYLQPSAATAHYWLHGRTTVRLAVVGIAMTVATYSYCKGKSDGNTHHNVQCQRCP